MGNFIIKAISIYGKAISIYVTTVFSILGVIFLVLAIWFFVACCKRKENPLTVLFGEKYWTVLFGGKHWKDIVKTLLTGAFLAVFLCLCWKFRNILWVFL